MTDGTTTWREVMAETTRRLSTVTDAPAVEARWIVERASGNEGSEHLRSLDDPVTQRAMHFHDLMVERRLGGEPVQYVLGRWAFRSLDLLVDRRVLIPRPETEVVAGLALAELDRARPAATAEGRSLRAVDLGTGSGAIGLTLASERERVDVWLTDRSTDALAVARANLAGIGRAATRVTVLEGAWFDALPDDLQGSFDVIVSNPPYVATDEELDASVRNWEPEAALFSGTDGLDDLRVIVADAPRWSTPHGSLVLELDPRQVDDVVVMARAAGYAEVTVHRDLAGRDRAIVARLVGS